MREPGLYLVEAILGKCKIHQPPQGSIHISLRIGKNSTNLTINNPNISNSSIDIFSVLQLNVDNTALQTQRCSLTLNAIQNNEKKILGIALISLPKDKNQIENSYKLTQSEDKTAQIDLKIKIVSIDQDLSNQNRSAGFPQDKSSFSFAKDNIKKDPVPPKQIKIIMNNENKLDAKETQVSNYSNTVSHINVKSKISSEQSSDKLVQDPQQKKTFKSFKNRETEKTIEITDSELKKHIDEKECYFQLYQLQKLKGDAAMKFVANVLRNIRQKFPHLANILLKSNTPSLSDFHKQRKDSQALLHPSIIGEVSHIKTLKSAPYPNDLHTHHSQIEQNNRILTRQVEEYKQNLELLQKEVENLSKKVKGQIVFPTNEKNKELAASKSANFLLLNDIHDKPSKNAVEDTPPKHLNPFSGLNFKEWIHSSLADRKEMQAILNKLDQKLHSPEPANYRKQKIAIDRLYKALLEKKQITKDSVLNHKQELNKILDQIQAF